MSSSNIPFSTKPVPTLGQLRNVNINSNTLATGQVISYDATTNLWNNTAGGGGGGATITGTDEAVVFKNGVNGDAPNTGITKNTAFANYAATVDTAGKKLAIAHGGGAITDNLEVNGTGSLSKSGNKLLIEEDSIGLTVGVNNLRLFSHNSKATADSITQVDSSTKNVASSAFQTYNPSTVDAPNTGDTNSMYKIQLDLGMDKEPGGGLFDMQEDYEPAILGFPTGQITEYQNKMNINNPMIMGRVATGVAITPASVYVISGFGNTFAFKDRIYYDPMQMRSRKSGNGWVWAGAPTVYRVADVKLGWTIKWYFQGSWAVDDPTNRLHMYINQYRSGVLLRTYLVGVSNNAQACFMSGERTFNTWTTAFGEDFDVLTDDWQVEIANQTAAGHNISVDLGQVELRCWLAQ